ncbi:MAG: acyl-CoA dehydrogenase family protein, partial [Nocardioides sp.]|uniref:acyl-CoA dehydrogenase family protein n=1 Tax=Nocardioides sp. TaxID=35761 RepID=UPI003F125C67
MVDPTSVQPALMSPGGRHGLSSKETRAPLGYAMAALNRLAQSELVDRLGVRKRTEQVVFSATRGGFKAAAAASRQFARKGRDTNGVRASASTSSSGRFELTPTEDEQMLVDVVAELAAEVVRPAAAGADEAATAPADVLGAVGEVGLGLLGVPEELGGIFEERSCVAGVLVAGLAGLLFSPIAARLRGIYLGVASLGLVFIGQHVLNSWT